MVAGLDKTHWRTFKWSWTLIKARFLTQENKIARKSNPEWQDTSLKFKTGFIWSSTQVLQRRQDQRIQSKVCFLWNKSTTAFSLLYRKRVHSGILRNGASHCKNKRLFLRKSLHRGKCLNRIEPLKITPFVLLHSTLTDILSEGGFSERCSL